MSKNETPQFTIITDAKPVRKHNITGRTALYPFAEMEIGEMLLVPGKTSKNFGGTVRMAEQRTGFAFSIYTGPVSDAQGNEVVPAGSVGVLRLASKPVRKPKEHKKAA